MSFSLSNNFLLNARGITFLDGSGVTWTFNKNTNTIGAVVASPTGGTVTSVSVATANGVSGSVATATATPAITLTLGDITPSSVVASGAVTGSNVSGSTSGVNTGDQVIPAAHSPTATAGLSVVNGSAPTFMRSDGAPPIGQAIVPTWSALHTFTGGLTVTSGGALTIDTFTLALTGNSSISGTNTGDQVIPAAHGPTAVVGLAAVSGSASTFMRSDGAPPIDQTIAPTWTGTHTYSASAGAVGVSITSAGSGGVTPPLKVNCGANLIQAFFDNTAANGAFVQFMNSAVAKGYIGTGAQTITGAALADFCIAAATGVLRLGYNNGAATALAIANANGAITCSGQFAINGGTPTAALTGFGSPSGTPTAGLTNASTLAQTAGTLAALLAYLKTIGIVAA